MRDLAPCRDAIDRALIEDFQRDFPLTARPFAAIAARLATSEADVVARLQRLVALGAVSRVGAVVRPHAAGASTLAALAAPPERLDEIAVRVDAEPGVSHNYARTHAFNLWFVVTGANLQDVAASLARIERDTGLPVLDLPLERAFHIDLGFAMSGARAPVARRAASRPIGRADENDRALLAAIEGGLPLIPTPFAAIGARLALSETQVVARLAAMLARNVVGRFGVVVKHRAFGYAANAMAVWNLDDARVDSIAAQFAEAPEVTLCYRRPRRLPHWPYNLFTMIHARARDEAGIVIERLAGVAGDALAGRATLFSTHCYKQRGATFAATERAA